MAEPRELNPREVRREARLARVREATAPSQPYVKVWPTSEDMRRVLKHPSGVAFRSEMGQSVEWPNDTFTARRIRDGDVSIEGAVTAKRSDPDPKLSAREQHAARRPKPKQQSPEESRAAAARPKASS